MPAKDSDLALDGQLEIKKRSRRRLVGAAALALFAAVVLPMVMDQEPRPAIQDLQVRIPSPNPDAGGRDQAPIVSAESAPPNKSRNESKTAESINLKPTDTVKPAESGNSTNQISPPVPAAKSAPSSDKSVATDKPAAGKTVVEPPAAKPVEKPAEKIPNKPGNSVDSSRAAALLGDKSDNGQWVVQLGAYKEAGNVKSLLAKLKQMGIAGYAEDFASAQGPRTRVRAGPFSSREAAEKAQQRIHKIGVDGPVAAK